MGLYGGSGTTITHHTQNTAHKITHRTQTKHNTQNYKNNKGHILHTINTTTIQIQLQ
jgi:hypothetical protein